VTDGTSDRTSGGLEVRYGPDGLAPAVVQDAADGRVLMVAWMDAEALAATIETGAVHFHSRSRGRLWRKGETSGNVLRLRGLATDCDADAILVTAEPAGPTCHRGTRSCFDLEAEVTAEPKTALPAGRRTAAEPSEPAGEDFGWLDTLWATIASRASERPTDSYTTRLLDGGVDAVGRKLTEEATEVLLAAKNDAVADAADEPRHLTRAALSGEVADLLYHALVLLAERDLAPGDVIGVLRERHARTP
jgi:phosphoribosyl-AMP cyclohydrolase / phosphoribosyl-ATP pyrophosphohydrolase